MTKTTRESLFTLAYIQHRFLRLPHGGLLPIPMRDLLIVGLAGSLIYASVQMRGAGLALLMIVLLFLAELAIRPPIRANAFAAAALFALPVGFALLAGAHAQKALARLKIGRFIVMGLIVGAGYGLMMLLFLIKSHVEIRLGTVMNQAFLGAKLGAAMGFGFELIDLIGPRPRRVLL